MKKSRLFPLLLAGAFFIMGFFGGGNNWWICRELKYQAARIFFSEQKVVLILQKDIDLDGRKEDVRFIIRKYPAGEEFNEGFIEISKDNKKFYSSQSLGWKLEMANVVDINNDKKLEIVSKWKEPTVNNIVIYSFDKDNGFRELLWASGQGVELNDIDGDGRMEIIEYHRDPGKNSEAYLATIYKWNGAEYALIKQSVPIVLDSLHGLRNLRRSVKHPRIKKI